MKTKLDNLRLTDKSKDLLAKLKRSTALEHWNEICRIAFALSIRDRSLPPPAAEGGKKGIEMTWKTFAGEYAEAYAGLLTCRHLVDSKKNKELSVEESLKRHVHRGLGILDAALSPKNNGSIFSLFGR